MYRRPSSVLKRLARSRRGNVAIVFALALPMVVGGAAFGVESTYWYFKDLELQAAADASAYAGGIDLRQGLADSVVTATATTEAVANGFDPAVGTIEVNTPPASGPNQHPRAVEVILAQQQERFFTSFFSQAPVIARARSVAVFSTASNACILALHPSASRAAQFSGATTVNLNGCSVMANSVAADAVNVQGSAVLSTECLVAVGGVSMNSGVTLTECTAPVTQAPRVADPFADLVQPSTAGPCRPSNAPVLQPGIYCNGLSLNGNVTLNPGVYVINGSDFRINANSFVQGSGVTFFLTGGSRIQFNGNARIEFSAPTTGPYAGVLFFGDPDSTGGRNTFNGTPNSIMTGALYFPRQAVEYLGNFSGQNGCTQVVGYTVEWTGSTSVGVDCTSFGMRPIPAMQLVRIAE